MLSTTGCPSQHPAQVGEGLQEEEEEEEENGGGKRGPWGLPHSTLGGLLSPLQAMGGLHHRCPPVIRRGKPGLDEGRMLGGGG